MRPSQLVQGLVQNSLILKFIVGPETYMQEEQNAGVSLSKADLSD